MSHLKKWQFVILAVVPVCFYRNTLKVQKGGILLCGIAFVERFRTDPLNQKFYTIFDFKFHQAWRQL